MKEPSWSTYIQHFGLVGGSSHRAKMYAYTGFCAKMYAYTGFLA